MASFRELQCRTEEGMQQRTWAEVDTNGKWNGGKERGSNFQTPRDVTDSLQCQIRREAEHDTKRGL